MEENFDSYNDDNDYTESLNRFEQMMKQGTSCFFDVEEFEVVIDHYLERGDKENAKSAIEMGLHQHPTSNAIKLKQAYYLAATHKPNRSLEILNAIELMEPFNIEIISAKATIYSQLRQHNKAIEYYTKGIKLCNDPMDITNAKINIAFEYENLNQFDKAIEILKDILKDNPENETVIYEIAFCYNLKNDNESSIKFFSAFVDQHPYSYSAWYNLGVSYNRAELYEKALDAYGFTIAIKEDFASAYFNQGNTLALMEDYEKAIASYRETFLYEDPDATTYYYIGECYEKLGDLKQALASYYKATRIDEFHADAWAGLAVVSETESKFQSALYYIKKAIELENDNSEYWYIYGDVLSKVGMVDEAITSYYKVVELDENNEDIWLDIAEVTRDYEDLEKSILYLYEGIKKQPENYLIYARLVAYLLMLGKEHDAIHNLVILLSNKKELLADLIEFYPETTNFPRVVDVIDNFTNKNEF